MFLVGTDNWNGLLALSVLCMIDLITALYVCVRNNIRITSRKLPNKIYGFSIYVLAIIAMNMLKIVSERFAVFTDIVLVYFSLTEGFSILEHVSMLGYKLPLSFLQNIRKDVE